MDMPETDSLNALLAAQNAKSKAAEDAFDAAIKGSPLMDIARALVVAAKIAGPGLAATFGGPLAGAAAMAAVKIAEAEGL